MTTVAWDTWVGMNPNTARKLGFKYNDLVRVKDLTDSMLMLLFILFLVYTQRQLQLLEVTVMMKVFQE